jgi:hypothetical protein
MNILQTIIESESNFVPKHFEDRIDFPDASIEAESRFEKEESRSFLQNPPLEAFLRNIPLSSVDDDWYFDFCLKIYSFWLSFCNKISNFHVSLWEWICDFDHLLQEKKTVKLEKKKEKQFIREQCKAMWPHILYFNRQNTFWQNRTSKNGETYRVRNTHNLVQDRNIPSLWQKEEDRLSLLQPYEL